MVISPCSYFCLTVFVSWSPDFLAFSNTLLFQSSPLFLTSRNCFSLQIISISMKTHTPSIFQKQQKQKQKLILWDHTLLQPLSSSSGELSMLTVSISLSPFFMNLPWLSFHFNTELKWFLSKSSIISQIWWLILTPHSTLTSRIWQIWPLCPSWRHSLIWLRSHTSGTYS